MAPVRRHRARSITSLSATRSPWAMAFGTAASSAGSLWIRTPDGFSRMLQKRHEKVNFYDMICSGATAWRNRALGLCRQQPPSKSLGNQVTEVLKVIGDRPRSAAGRRTLVSITIGANDFEFLNVVNLVLHLIDDTDEAFGRFVEERANQVADALFGEVNRLLRRAQNAKGNRAVRSPVSSSAGNCLRLPHFDIFIAENWYNSADF
ncbi:MAG: hypothetical protein KatS3mg089_0875 [Patescibacteria group bacterium]|nr:MAG: hypothetical protein KatS3mg089_0875 [Patescibacteria group bacterium]